MAEINDLSTTDSSNTARFPEGMNPSDVNDGARGLEGLLARGLKDTIDGVITTTGTGSAYVAAANRTLSAYYAGLQITVLFHAASGASPTLNVDAVGAQAIVWADGTAVAADDIPSGAIAKLAYDLANTRWVLLTVATAPGTIADDAVTTAKIADDAVTVDKIGAGAVGTTEIADDGVTPAKVQGAVNAQTGTSYTLVLGDAYKTVTMDNASANALTIPTNASVAFAVGDRVDIWMKGAGVTTVQGDTGVTVNGVSAGSVALEQYGAVSITKIATDTWLLAGGAVA
jgi:hypothetical protein